MSSTLLDKLRNANNKEERMEILNNFRVSLSDSDLNNSFIGTGYGTGYCTDDGCSEECY